MRILCVVLLFSYSLNIYAMHSDKQAIDARKHVNNVLKTQGPALKKHLKRADACIKEALANNPNGSKKELEVLKAFVQGKQAFEQDNCNEALSNCVDVIRADFDDTPPPPLLQEVRRHAFHIVQDLSDTKQHTLSRFFLMKSLLNAQSQTNVHEGLKRFDALFDYNVGEEDYQALSILFKRSEILADIKNRADMENNTHAQCIMAKYHLLLAERGAEMDGTPTEPRAELRKALAYAEKSLEGHYAPSEVLLAKIRIAIESRDAQSPRQLSRSVETFEEERLPEKHAVQEKVEPVRNVLPLKLLCALEVCKNNLATDHRQLYEYAKKLLDDPCDQLWLVGLDYLKTAVQLGNPFAAERLGDELYESDPVRALAYYEKALYTFIHAPSGSLWKLAGCFKRDALTWKIRKLCEQHEEVGAYQLACEYGQAAATEKWVHGIYNKSHVDALAVSVLSLESQYAKNKHMVEMLFLERVKTSGALRFMEQFCEHPLIQDVLIEVFALRANIGRGFVLEDKTVLAHYKKALHFILDPVSASKVAFKEPVKDELLLIKIQLDALPLQRRLIYVDAMLGVIKQLTNKELVEKKEAEYVCQLFVLIDEALRETTDRHLRNLAYERYVPMLSGIRQAALLSGTRDHLYVIGRCYADVGLHNGSLEALDMADKLLTRVPQGKGAKPAELYKKLAHVKVARARAAQTSNDMQAAHSFYKKAMQLCPEDTDIQWHYSQFLVQSGKMELRAEGVSLIEKLAQTAHHREAQAFMADGYCGKMPHIIAADTEKAIPFLQQLIHDEPIEDVGHRVMLATMYYEQAINATGVRQQKLIAKGLDLMRHYKSTYDGAHLMCIDLLAAASVRVSELLNELRMYKPEGQLSEKRLYELANAYFTRGAGQSDQVRRALHAKTIDLLQPIKDTSERAYLLLLTVLFEQRKFTQLAQELAAERKPYLSCLKECYRARSLLLQRKPNSFDAVLLHCERAFAAFEDHFIRTGAQSTQDLVDLISSVGVSECAMITHPMKVTSLGHIEEVIALLRLIIIEGECSDQERKRMLAHCGYFSSKIFLLCSGEDDTYSEYDNAMKIFIKSQELACDGGDLTCKSKLLTLLEGQIRFWLDTPHAGTLATRAKTATNLLMICAKLCKGDETALLHNPFHDIVVYANGVLHAADLTVCTEEDAVTLRLQQRIVAHILHSVKKQ